MSIADLVSATYEKRRGVWNDAEVVVKSWLERQCEALCKKDGDAARICIGGSRVKRESRAADKLRRNLAEDSRTFDDEVRLEDELHDIVGVKVLCKTTADLDEIWRQVNDDLTGKVMDDHGKHQLELVETKDYVKSPKQSGYRARHMLVDYVPIGEVEPVTVEIQLRTRLQDAWGELTHENSYKPGSAVKKTEFHDEVAKTMANLLAEVDRLAEQLARDMVLTVEGTHQPAAEAEVADDSGQVLVEVTESLARYALAEDEDGRRGLIPAIKVRELSGAQTRINVSDYIHVGDQLRVTVVDSEKGHYYYPVALPDRG